MLPLIRLFSEEAGLYSWMENVLKLVSYDGINEGSDPIIWAASRYPSLPESLSGEEGLHFTSGRWILSSYWPPEEMEPPLPLNIAACIPIDTRDEEAAALVKTVLLGWDVTPARRTGGADRSGTESANGTVILSGQEEKVLQLLAAGEASKTIAADLGISESTVKFHINSLFGKLDARNRAQVVYNALAMGLLVV